MRYSDEVMDHFANPRHVGVMEDADGVGEVGNPTCGDMMTFYIKVKDDRISDIRFQTFGCGAAIAVSSMVSEMALGKTLEEAEAISKNEVAEKLGGLPKNKMHCSNLGTDALKAAIDDYRHPEKRSQKKAAAHDEEEHDDCVCPYCGEHMHGEAECRPCSIKFDVCDKCGEVVTHREEHVCSDSCCS